MYAMDSMDLSISFPRPCGCFMEPVTCSMKPRKQGGAVYSRLNVYGVPGLKVADLSISSDNIPANTYPIALVIWRKAAAIIAEEVINGVV